MTLFLETLKEAGIPYREVGQHHHATHGRIQIDCPFCGPGSQGFHLGFNIERVSFHCWRCGFLRISDVLSALRIQHVAAQLYQSREKVASTGRQASEGAKTGVARGVCQIPYGVGPLLAQHKRYLRRKRGFSRGEIEKLVEVWKVGGIGIAPRLSWRLFIPIIFDGETVSWTTRSISDESRARYISARPREEAVPGKSVLYGGDSIRGHSIIVCEGPTDAWRIGNGAVATCGTSFTRHQLLSIVRCLVRVVVFDSEPKAQARAKRMCDYLEGFGGETYNVVLSAKDPGSASRKEIRELRRRFLQ